MNYVKINGTDSRTINGLIICQLPPITRPMMRTQVTTIDGRPGDIVTELGYAAYDKTIEIGVKDIHLVDAVIDYFSTSGEIIFSNEPDKKYNFAQVGQIDFERLVRFRTATVTVHVQPYKYPVKEDQITSMPAKTTGTLTIENKGNADALPLYYFSFVLNGSTNGYCDLSVNGGDTVRINFSSTQNSFYLDTDSMNAYLGTTFLNQYVEGDPQNLALAPGDNTLTFATEGTSWLGYVSIDSYTRWK